MIGERSRVSPVTTEQRGTVTSVTGPASWVRWDDGTTQLMPTRHLLEITGEPDCRCGHDIGAHHARGRECVTEVKLSDREARLCECPGYEAGDTSVDAEPADGWACECGHAQARHGVLGAHPCLAHLAFPGHGGRTCACPAYRAVPGKAAS